MQRGRDLTRAYSDHGTALQRRSGGLSEHLSEDLQAAVVEQRSCGVKGHGATSEEGDGGRARGCFFRGRGVGLLTTCPAQPDTGHS